MTVIAVIAKECLPGRVKTRLQPDYTAHEAATIAAASLATTLAGVSGLPASRRILYFDGAVVPSGAEDWEVIAQCGDALDERIAFLFDLVDEPMLLLGMDTPHFDPDILSGVFEAWGDTDAWFGPATDGGFWALGMREPDGSLVRGVPMSTEKTGALQLLRLARAGMTVRLLPPLTDIDTAADLAAVVEVSTRFRTALGSLGALVVA
jgi:hypothetical protein